MNILINPMYSVDVINSDSNYIIAKNLVELTPEHNFFLIIDKNRKYYKDNLPKNVKLLYTSLEISKRRQVLNFQTQTMKKILDTYPITHILNSVVEQGHNLKYFNTQVDRDYHHKVINYHHYNIHPSFDRSVYNTMKNVLYQQLIGSLDVEVNYFHTQHSYNMFLEEANQVLNKDYMKHHLKVHVSLGGHVQAKYFKQNVKKYDKYTFIYNHRLAGYKRYKTTLDMFDELYKYNQNFQVIFTCGDNSNESRISSKPYAMVKSLKDYQDYIDELQKCHANVTNSAHETFCISIAESMFDNQVIIAPNAVTFPELLTEDYPYLFNSTDEQLQIMKELLDKDIRTYTHKQKLTADRTVNELKKLLIEHDYKKKVFINMKDEKKKQKIKKIDNASISFKDFTRTIYNLGLAPQSFPPNKLALLAEELGYKYSVQTNMFHKKN